MTDFSVSKNISLSGKHGKPVITDVFVPSGDGPFPVVIFSHGFKGFKDWGPFNIVASEFARQKFIFVKMNFAFNGTTAEDLFDFTDLEAFGNNNFTKELDDLEVVLNWIEQNVLNLPMETNNISLVGHSRGGGIALLKSFEDTRVTRVAGWASVAGFERHITKSEILNWKKTGVHFVENARTGQSMPLFIQLYNDFIKNHRRLNIVNAVKSMGKPVLLAHSKNDDTIPFDQVRALADLNPENVRFISLDMGGHTFDAAHPFEGMKLPSSFQLVVNQTIEFLKTT